MADTLSRLGSASADDDLEDVFVGGLKILVVTRGVLPLGVRAGGAERVAYRLATTLAREGHDVSLVSDVDQLDGELPEALKILPIGRSSRLLERLPSTFGRWLAQHLLGNLRVVQIARRAITNPDDGIPFDAVHAHGALAALMLARTPGCPAVVYTEHDSTPWACEYRHWWERAIRRFLYRAINLRACRVASAVSTPFPQLADELSERTGMPRSHFHTVLNAFWPDTTSAEIVPESGAAPVSPEVPRAFDRYFLFVGTLTNRKAPDVLLRALSSTDMNCIFVGDGDMRGRLEQLALQLGVSDRVHFAGALAPHEVLEMCRKAEALVLPSYSETLPLVILEAFRCGTPVIATRVGGIPLLVKHERTGLLVGVGDVAQLASALQRVGSNPEFRDQLAGGARAAAHQHPDYLSAMQRYLEIYRNLGSARVGTCSA